MATELYFISWTTTCPLIYTRHPFRYFCIWHRTYWGDSGSTRRRSSDQDIEGEVSRRNTFWIATYFQLAADLQVTDEPWDSVCHPLSSRSHHDRWDSIRCAYSIERIRIKGYQLFWYSGSDNLVGGRRFYAPRHRHIVYSLSEAST